ncbi:MAG: hypothetical protein PHI97_15860 [Desulfobulbus sp.]|nr:hypothetical protein [Desulfobulbus sp.]
MVVVNFILVGLLLVILQTTVFMPKLVWLPAPDFYFVLVAFLAYRLELLHSLIILFPLACFLDVLCGTVLGSYALICFGCFFFVKTIAGKLPIRETLYQIPLIGVAYLVVHWLVYLLLNFLQPGQLVPWSWWQMLIRALLVVVLGYPLFYFFEKVRKFSLSNFLPWNRLRLRTDNRRRRRT